MGRPYDEETRIVDVQSGDQLSVHCPCGHRAQKAWALLPRPLQERPLTKLQDAMICQKCGRRRPTIVIQGIVSTWGSTMGELFRWPPVG